MEPKPRIIFGGIQNTLDPFLPKVTYNIISYVSKDDLEMKNSCVEVGEKRSIGLEAKNNMVIDSAELGRANPSNPNFETRLGKIRLARFRRKSCKQTREKDEFHAILENQDLDLDHQK